MHNERYTDGKRNMILEISNTFEDGVVRIRFDGRFIAHLNKAMIEDMRSWASECEWREDLLDDEGFDAWKLSDKEIIRGIENNFDGGLQQFVGTYEPT